MTIMKLVWQKGKRMDIRYQINRLRVCEMCWSGSENCDDGNEPSGSITEIFFWFL